MRKRPELNRIYSHVIERGRCAVTMSPGQWDCLLEAAYDQGAVLLELDDEEKIIAAYRKETKHAC